MLPPEEEPGGWVSIEPSRDTFPANCVACGGSTQDRAEVQFTDMRVPPLVYPLCRGCGAKYTWIERAALWGTMLAVILIVSWIGYSAVASSAEGKKDPLMQLIIGGSIGLLGGLLIWVVIWLILKRFMPYPVKLSTYDDARNVYRLRFAFAGFVELLQQSVGRKPLPRVGSGSAEEY
jgi:hypothetical protein